MLKPTIISISMATVMAGAAIAPALGVIAQAFPDASTTTIKMILTIPSLTIIPFTFITSFLTKKISKRTILLIGLCTYLIGGLGPQFMPTIELVLFFRLLLGASVGILMPLSESLIYDYYTGQERAQMMGYNTSFSNFGSIITMLAAGWLATLGWKQPFNVYLLGIVIFLLVYFFLPKEKVRIPPAHERNLRIPFSVYGYALAMGGVILAYYALSTNMALFLEEANLGGPALAGMAVSFAAVGGMITSFFLVPIMGFFKVFLIPVMLLAMGGSFLMLTLAKHIFIIMLGACIIGFAQGTLFPVLTMNALNHVKLHQTDRAIAVLTTFIFTGQFLSPVLLDMFSNIFNQTSLRFQFALLAGSLFVFVIIIFLSLIKKVIEKATETYSAEVEEEQAELPIDA